MRSAYAIETEGLAKSYGSVGVLDRVDLRVEAGSVFALLGPNGAGKTTAVRILATLTRPDAGSARVDGLDVVADVHAVRPRISLTGQYAALDELQTGEENLRMLGRIAGLGRRRAAARTDELLERFGLADARPSRRRFARCCWAARRATPGRRSRGAPRSSRSRSRRRDSCCAGARPSDSLARVNHGGRLDGSDAVHRGGDGHGRPR